MQWRKTGSLDAELQVCINQIIMLWTRNQYLTEIDFVQSRTGKKQEPIVINVEPDIATGTKRKKPAMAPQAIEQRERALKTSSVKPAVEHDVSEPEEHPKKKQRSDMQRLHRKYRI